MKAYRTYARITKSRRVVLSDLPFEEGQRVEVVVLGNDRTNNSIEQARILFDETQALPTSRAVNEEEIREEVAKYRKLP